MSEESKDRPITYKLALWYSFGLAVIFMLYSGVKIVLSFLDKDYSEVNQLIIFLVYGIIVLLFAYGLKNFKNWGKFGLAVINSIFFIFAMLGNSSLSNELIYINIFIGLVTVGIIYCLFAPQTNKYLSRQG